MENLGGSINTSTHFAFFTSKPFFSLLKKTYVFILEKLENTRWTKYLKITHFLVIPFVNTILIYSFYDTFLEYIYKEMSLLYAEFQDDLKLVII